MGDSIDNAIQGIYQISELHEKAKQKASSLKGRKQEIQRRIEKEWGVTTVEELIAMQRSLGKEIKAEEQKIIELYKELKGDFDNE